MSAQTLTAAPAAPAPPTSDTALRERALQLVAEAPAEHLRTVIAYFEVALAKPQASSAVVPPPVPALLVRPSDEQLAEELKAMREANAQPIPSQEAYAMIQKQLA